MIDHPADILILAAGTAPAFVSEIVVLLVASAVLAYVFHRLRIMPIVSFLIAGALIGPQALGLVQDETLIEAAAEVGVILLLFTIGMEFSLERLARIQRLILVGGGIQVAVTVVFVVGALSLLGVDWRAGIFTGFLVALSSTAIVMKLLMNRGETNTESGTAALGILIFQDLAVVAMVLLVPALAGERGSSLDLALALGKAVGIVVLVLVVARRVMPKVLEAVARTCSQEIFLLTVVAICFGTAWLTNLAGVSLSLGAFLAGIVISESRFSEMAIGEILPLQVLFSATFFVSVGLLLDLNFLVVEPLVVIAAIAGVLLVKTLATGLSLKVLGYSSGTTVITALLMAQVGEFSFVLERVGRSAGLFPGGVEDGGPQAFIASTVVLMMITPLLAGVGRRISHMRTRRTGGQIVGPATGADVESSVELRDHVIIAGYGETGRSLARTLSARGVPYLILTLSPEGAREAESENLHVLRGNYTRRHELTQAAIRQARILVVADDDLDTTRRVVSAARALNPDLRVIARTRFESEASALRSAGASDVVAEDRSSIMRLVSDIVKTYAIDSESKAPLFPDDPVVEWNEESDERGSPQAPVQLSEQQRRSGNCSHAAEAVEVVPSGRGCQECIDAGDTWVHLRVCMTCGNVGCCDSSKNRHASKHFRTTGHPIVKSMETGEDWAWCYIDRTMV